MELRPGATHEVSWTVTPDKTTDAMGRPGVRVLATPRVLDRAAKKGG